MVGREIAEVGANVGEAVLEVLGHLAEKLPVHRISSMLFTYKPERDIGTVTVLGDRRQHGILALYDGRQEEAKVRYHYWTYLPPMARKDGGYHLARIIPDTRLIVRCPNGHTQGAWGNTVYWIHDKGQAYYCAECEGGKRVKKFVNKVPTEIVETLDPEAACNQNPGIMQMVHRLSSEAEDLGDTIMRLPRVWAVILLRELPVDNLKIDDPFRIQERITRQDNELKTGPYCIIPLAIASKFKVPVDRILVEAIQGVGMVEPDALYGNNNLDYPCRMLNTSKCV